MRNKIFTNEEIRRHRCVSPKKNKMAVAFARDRHSASDRVGSPLN